jgi:methylthioribose-1-phosphate isomerase
MVYVDETRPYLQGARLTAYELQAEGIPYQVICDSAAAYLMQCQSVDMVIVGADRIAANGDTANKIGTYGLAVQAHHHGLPFFVAAPLSSFDVAISSGAKIRIEERGAEELRLSGGKQVTPLDAPVFNPAFDVTPAALISAIVTERGIVRPPTTEKIAAIFG